MPSTSPKPTRRRVYIKGSRGDWTAEVEGRRLAVLHSSWRVGMTGYHDPMTGAKIDGKDYAKYMAALMSEGLVVVQKDKPGTLDRDGYIGVFTFKDLAVEESGAVALNLVARYADPR